MECGVLLNHKCMFAQAYRFRLMELVNFPIVVRKCLEYLGSVCMSAIAITGRKKKEGYGAIAQ